MKQWQLHISSEALELCIYEQEAGHPARIGHLAVMNTIVVTGCDPEFRAIAQTKNEETLCNKFKKGSWILMQVCTS
jgi:hypothetical protein